jgi:hypothetical protein
VYKNSDVLSTFDRIGVVVVALVGACLGWGIATASDIRFTPMLAVFLPGCAVGFVVSKFVGLKVAVIVSGVANGAIYGLVLYGWNRLANAISGRRPKL